ncbi:uncharacterized protein ACR2FA_010395 [Aphomia sociella]
MTTLYSYVYDQLPKTEFDIVFNQYLKFISIINDPTTEPVKVFKPLSPKHNEELELIREVSKELQEKKDEEVKRLAQAREAEEQERKEENAKETEDEKSNEEPKEDEGEEPKKE